MGCICNGISLILQHIVLGLILAGILLDEFRPRKGNSFGERDDIYITLWGIKKSLYTYKYTYRPSDIWSKCPNRVNNFKVAAYAAIATLIVALVRTLVGILQSCCCYFCFCPISALLSAAGSVLGGISIGYMLFNYYKDMGDSTKASLNDGDFFKVNQCMKLESYTGVYGLYNKGMEIGLGLKLFIAGCVLNTLNILIIAIPL